MKHIRPAQNKRDFPYDRSRFRAESLKWGRKAGTQSSAKSRDPMKAS